MRTSGVNLHLGPSMGEMIHWYIFISAIKGKLSICSSIFICYRYQLL